MKQYVYRLYTQDMNREGIVSLIQACGFDSFTLSQGIGYWINAKELSLSIEIISNEKANAPTKLLASAIRSLNNQTAVYWITFQVESELIGLTKEVSHEVSI